MLSERPFSQLRQVTYNPLGAASGRPEFSRRATVSSCAGTSSPRRVPRRHGRGAPGRIADTQPYISTGSISCPARLVDQAVQRAATQDVVGQRDRRPDDVQMRLARQRLAEIVAAESQRMTSTGSWVSPAISVAVCSGLATSQRRACSQTTIIWLTAAGCSARTLPRVLREAPRPKLSLRRESARRPVRRRPDFVEFPGVGRQRTGALPERQSAPDARFSDP